MSETSAPTVVQPGSPGDPFSTRNPEVAAEFGHPVVGQPGSDGRTTQPATTTQPAPVAAAPAAPASGGGLTEEQISTLFQDRLVDATKGLERRISAQATELKTLRQDNQRIQQGAKEQVRQAQLQGLSERDRTAMQEVWTREDQATAISGREQAVMDLYKATEGLRLFLTYGEYGVTEEELLAAGSVEEMESLAKDKAIEFLRTGGQSKAQAQKTVEAVAKAPAGASAQADLGNQPPVQDGAKLLSTGGLDAMAANVKTLFSEGSPRPW